MPANPVIQGLQQMAADKGLPGLNQIQASDARGQLTSAEPVKTPEQIEHDKYLEEMRQKQIEAANKILMERKDQRRIRINQTMELHSWNLRRQPTDAYNKLIGHRGYKWLDSFKAGDGNYYARYTPVVGGSNVKIYSISEEKWFDQWESQARFLPRNCPNCQAAEMFVRPTGPSETIPNTCPSCSKQFKVNRYSLQPIEETTNEPG